MFRKNEDHRQMKMFTVVESLPDTAKKLLEESWAYTFYHDFFSRLDESLFKNLYSDKKSRPNTPVNILICFEVLKSGFGWSDEETYSHFLFDMQMRYALGLHDFDEQYFDLRTIYHFRRALIEYENESGENLIQKAIEQVTDEQLEQFKLKTGLQRMDSTQIQSNIRNMSRIQLLVEMLHRFHRVLEPQDRKKHEERFSVYIKQNAQHYCYKVKRGEASTRLQRIGEDYAFFLEELKSYKGKEAYDNLYRVFNEHFKFEEKVLIVLENKEMKGSNLQSPDDTEATYRSKRGEGAKGYVANITETCDPENEVQLITRCSVEPNISDDQELMRSDLENLSGRMEVDELVTDAGYSGTVGGESVDKHGINHKTTAIKGRKKAEGKAELGDFKEHLNEANELESLECPAGFSVKVRKTNSGYSVGYDNERCQACPLKDECPTKPLKKKPVRIFRFTDNDRRIARQRKKLKEEPSVINIRASVECTVRSVIHPFGGHLCKMPVRGKIRIASMIILGSAMVNIRRITEYYRLKREQEAQKLTAA